MATPEQSAKDADTKGDTNSLDQTSATSSNDQPKSPEAKDEITNDGVKILEEVFGKASVGDAEESMIVVNAAGKDSTFGPEPPKEEEYDPEVLKKAEEFKT